LLLPSYSRARTYTLYALSLDCVYDRASCLRSHLTCSAVALSGTTSLSPLLTWRVSIVFRAHSEWNAAEESSANFAVFNHRARLMR
jgi:hypothetical protein